MKIGTFVRTFRDFEESTIAEFIESHSWCDQIYVGLCGTSLKTVEIASRYPNTKLRVFNGFEMFPDGSLGAHESKYYSFLLDWSQQEDLDFVIFDDADHICNPALQRDARHMLELYSPPYAYTLLMYLWGRDFYFPDLNKCVPSERLWGWNPRLWTPDINPDPPFTIEIRNQPDAAINDGLVFPHPPYTLLHYSWLTEEIARKKMAFNAKRGVPQAYPPDSCGTLELLPDWANQ